MPNYITVFVVAGVVVFKDGKILMVQERRLDVVGKWNLPAGRVEEGDNVEITAIKEAREESGYDVKIIKKLGIFQGDVNDACKHIFLAEILGEQHQDNELECGWFGLEEIRNMKDKLRGEWIVDVINNLAG